MAGKSVNCRYTEENKAKILSSRLESTAILCKAIAQTENPPQLWINSSSATTYVHSESQQMTEDEGIIGDDFSMGVCKKWEAEFFSCQLDHTRKVATRTSIVLGNSGGAYPMLKKITRLGMGGRQGLRKSILQLDPCTRFLQGNRFHYQATGHCRSGKCHRSESGKE